MNILTTLSFILLVTVVWRVVSDVDVEEPSRKRRKSNAEKDGDFDFRKYKRLNRVDSVEDYAEGDIDPTLLSMDIRDFKSLVGDWEILLKRSDPADDILGALGVPFIKRSILRRSVTTTSIDDVTMSDDGRNFTHFKSSLPMNTIKEGRIYVDNQPFSVVDKDTGVWRATAMISEGRLLQKRVSKKGIMYDVRATFLQDPEGIVEGGPLQLFKWTFITRAGVKYVSNRWFRKIDAVERAEIE